MGVSCNTIGLDNSDGCCVNRNDSNPGITKEMVFVGDICWDNSVLVWVGLSFSDQVKAGHQICGSAVQGVAVAELDMVILSNWQ